ncbi:tail fiber protein [Klebsiella phage KpS8]|uniref:Tail fiber protein n=1 Tax=Klebsiella phage KpS8 TaxID=2847815 RepID=A0A6H0X3Z9_9CAUD|nr:tail fiber protein [Klebsiella phage KpS8]QIW88213.1 tail fiber protein [Klebsiella phage KpS8]
MADTTQFEQAVDQVIEDSERLHKVVNGSAIDTVIVEDGSTIPTLRKALLDNVYFKTPPQPWVAGTQATVFNQLYSFTNSAGTFWWYAPGASPSTPITLPADPSTSTAWKVYNDSVVVSEKFAPLNTPAFVGSPTAPTPAQGSNSGAIATTAFVNLAVAAAINSLAGSSPSYAALTVVGASTLNTLVVSGTSQFGGTLDASGVLGKFQKISLSGQTATLSFDYTAASNYLKTIISPNSVQTNNLTSAVIVNGTASADNTTMSLTGVGNNTFDYVYIRGNSSKASTEPRLKVTGTTELENVRVTGSLSGVNVGVDGLDIHPNSIITTTTAQIGSDLTVNGVTTLGSASIQNLGVVSSLTVNGNSTLTGGFTAGSASSVAGNLSITGLLAVTGAVTVSTNLTVTGNANLNNGGTGTTTVNNLNVLGTLTGVSVDVNGKNINPNSVLATTTIEAYGSLKGASLVITGEATAPKVTANFVGTIPGSVTTPSAGTTWTPGGTGSDLTKMNNIYNVDVTNTLTIGPWANLGSAFTATIYLFQDATGGHAVTLDASYKIINGGTISTAANSVTILQVTYCGRGTVYDVAVYQRP